MDKPSKEQLKKLIEITQKKFDEFECPVLDLSNTTILYIPTKKRNFIGIKAGIGSLSEMKTYKVKESASIRSNCKFYHKVYKTDGKVVKIESFAGGHDRLDNCYIAYYEDGYRYLFPFYNQAKAAWLYTFVTRFEDGKVIEEYMVGGNQIVYEKYEYSEDNIIDYYYINYVPTGKYPILAEADGYYISDTMEYVEKHNYAWYQDEQ